MIQPPSDIFGLISLFEGYIYWTNFELFEPIIGSFTSVREGSQKCVLDHLQVELLSKTLKDGNPNVGISNTRINFVKDRLHSKKVFIVLDDVDNLEQLEY